VNEHCSNGLLKTLSDKSVPVRIRLSSMRKWVKGENCIEYLVRDRRPSFDKGRQAVDCRGDGWCVPVR